MDASQYKDYVLFMLFVKYVSDKYADSDDYAPPVVIPDGASFGEMLNLRGTSDIGDRINKQVIAPLTHANPRLASSEFPDFNDANKLGEGKEMVDRLTNLINIFASPHLNFSRNRAEHDDILGDAYEYLMQHFASESGKSKGQFYTPAEVSRVIAQTIGISSKNTKAATTVYDPTCGSGSLLLKVAAAVGKQITLEGQEKDGPTAGMARMNMILHDFPTAVILQGNTLTAPKFKNGERLRTYDYVVANPPFSDKSWLTGLTPATDSYERFSWGIPPDRQGDYAYLLHIIRSMKPTGKAGCVLPHGVLFRGKSEATIRKNLVLSGFLKGVIGLPPNLFYGTGIPACIVVLDKENAVARKGVFMIDASKGFSKQGSKNRLRERDIHRIVDTFERQVHIDGFARMVPIEEIADKKNDFNLNLPRYIDGTAAEDFHDIEGHIRGGIPVRDVEDLENYWHVFPNIRKAMFKSSRRVGYLQLRLALTEVKQTIQEHDEFREFQARIETVFSDWYGEISPFLKSFEKGDQPKLLLAHISEALLANFHESPLLDAYEIYQYLMDYWEETMQDDTYLIASEGWLEGVKPHEILPLIGKNNRKVWPEPHDYKIGKRRFKSDLVPATILTARYFNTEINAIRDLDDQINELVHFQDEMIFEHGDEDGLLAHVIDWRGDIPKITQKRIGERLSELGENPLFAEERAALEEFLRNLKEFASIKKVRNREQKELDIKIDQKYAELSDDEVKSIVVDSKWFSYLTNSVESEVSRVMRKLSVRITQLAERYATPLPRLSHDVNELSERVDGHLRTMGFVWD